MEQKNHVAAQTVFGGAAIAAVATAATAFLAPMNMNIDYMMGRIKRMEEEMRGNTEAHIRTAEKMREIETQFRWQSDAQKHRYMNSDRIDRLLWKKVFLEDLASIDITSAGPAGNSAP